MTSSSMNKPPQLSRNSSWADTLPMADKVVLITGGIGKATAIGLATIGARVGITGSDLARAKQAAADIHAASGKPAADVFAADMTSQAGVRRLAVAALNAYPRLDMLINNVGGFWAHRHLTADGLERTFALVALPGAS
jgi:retinol dehydrogenase-14